MITSGTVTNPLDRLESALTIPQQERLVELLRPAETVARCGGRGLSGDSQFGP